MRIPSRYLHDTATVVALFMTTGAFQSLLVDSSDQLAVRNGSPLMQAMWTLIYTVSVLRLIPKYREVVALVRTNKFLFSLIIFAFISVVWSVDPGLTLRRSVALAATTLVGVDFAIRYTAREQLRLLATALGLFVFVSIIVQLFFPSLIPGLDYLDEAWHGIVSYKNTFARIVVLAAVVMLCRSRSSLWKKMVLAGALLLVWAANSKGALVVLITLLACFGAAGALRWSSKKLSIVVAAGMVMAFPLVYFLLHNLSSVTGLLGRDATLTGRADIWQLTLRSIARRPICGYGYAAFWSAFSQEAMRIRGALNWEAAPHAHNGYIDLALGMGLSGLFLYLGGYVIAMRRAIRSFRQDLEREAIWPAIYLIFIFLYQLTESSIVAPNTIFWILYIAAACSVSEIRHSFGPESALETQLPTANTGMYAIRDYA